MHVLQYNVQALKAEGVSNAFKEAVETPFEGDVDPKSTVDEAWHRFRRALSESMARSGSIYGPCGVSPLSPQSHKSWLANETQDAIQDKKNA